MEGNLTKLQLVGQGTYGVVYKAQNTQNKEILAVKKIKISTNDEGLPSTAIREIALLKELHHRNIIKLYDVLHSQYCLTLIFEYCDWDLHRYMETQGFALSEAEIISFIHQLLLALEYIHSSHIIHRDVKPQNLLVNKKKELKLADFGLARSTFIPVGTLSTEVVTLWYRPPEILAGVQDYGFAVDIWSAGCVLVEMITGNPLFPCQTSDDLTAAVCRVFGVQRVSDVFPQLAASPAITDELRHAAPVGLKALLAGCDSQLLDLAEKLLDVDPKTRISAADAVKHPVFNK